MQRYNASSCASAVNNTAFGGQSVRDGARTDTPSLSNFSLNSRRPQQPSYKLKCDKEILNVRLGPPDFHSQTPNCPEETLTREYAQSGYKDYVEGIEDTREISLSEVQRFTKPVVFKCKEAIRKRLRAINEARAQKRKAGQVYGVALSGLLLSKPGIFPEQSPCDDDFQRKWIEGLSQPHKRLRSLADIVPHGPRKKSIFEVLMKNNVPLLKATWFIKVIYLNQLRPGSSSGASEKNQFSRTEQWTKDVIDYMQCIVDDFFSRDDSYHISHEKDRLLQKLYTGPIHLRGEPFSTGIEGEEPSLHFKWWYMVRLLQWHLSEGLLLPSNIIDWILNQLQVSKKVPKILQLLLPIIYGLIHTIVLSQTYVRTLVGVAVTFIREPPPGGLDLVDNSRRAYMSSAIVELLRYLLMVVPNTFVALECFPLPHCVVSNLSNHGSFLSKVSENASKIRNGPVEVASVSGGKRLGALYNHFSSFNHVVSSIQKRADILVKATSPGFPCHNLGKAVQALDKALVLGDVRVAYKILFGNLCDGGIDGSWMAEVTPCLRSSLKQIGNVSSSFICSTFFLCEWAAGNFRDFLTAPPHDMKFSGRKDYSQIYIAVRLIKLKMKDLQNSLQCTGDSVFQDIVSSRNSKGAVHGINNYLNTGSGKGIDASYLFQSPGPLHDIIVCWIDQHEMHKGHGFMCLQLLIMELTRSGIFYPQVYVRQLIVSGIMDGSGSLVEQYKRKKHYQVLKQLPGSFVHDALEETQIVETPLLLELVKIYANERLLVLREYNSQIGANISPHKQKRHRNYGRDGPNLFSKNLKIAEKILELKSAISVLLQLPNSSPSTDTCLDDFQGTVMRSIGTSLSTIDTLERTGCEECKRVKKQKVWEDNNPCLPGYSPNFLDDEDIWWVKKGKPIEPLKVDPLPLKPAKQVSKGRLKTVRKTQSLAQLAAARIEGSQGASSSHVCNNKICCPQHKIAVEGEASKSINRGRISCGDVASVGKALKHLPFVERRAISGWLIDLVKQCVDETGKSSVKVGQFNKSSFSGERNPLPWKLGDEELAMILYFMDVSIDIVITVRFLLSLLPKVIGAPNSTIHGGRNIMLMPRVSESHAIEVSEAFLLSSIRRYENVMVAADLIPDALSSMIQRSTAILACNGRGSSNSATLFYAKQLLKKYGSIPSVMEWEKNVRATCDKRIIADLESGRSVELEMGVENPDDNLRQKLSGSRFSRVAVSMREIVQRNVEDAFQYKDRKLFVTGSAIGKWDNVHEIAKKIFVGLMECLRQTGGAAQEGDPSLLASAVSAIVSNVGPALVKCFSRHILQIHVICLCQLKEAFGERHSRVFEIALATEASSALAGVFSPSKVPRSQFQVSSESHDSNPITSNEVLNNYKRPTKIVAAVSALVVQAIVHGFTTLERMVSVFRLREGLDVIHFTRSAKCSSNGNVRSVGTARLDSSIEVSVSIHWFRVLIGNCRNVCDGLVVEILGEPSIIALSRMQRTLPISSVFPPAYSLFAFFIWKPLIVNKNTGSVTASEDIHQLYQSLTSAIGDIIKHLPFRDVFMRDTNGFYDLVASDATESEFAAMVGHNGFDTHMKATAFIPLRARIFLNCMVDCKMPKCIDLQDDFSHSSGLGETKAQHMENESRLLGRLVDVLDTLQPAKFHWQWVELRLLLNEQALIEKLETHDVSLIDALRSLSPNSEKVSASENENNFIQIILTRLLVRPDAASLFSEVVHRLGRSLEDSMLMQAKWLLCGQDVLLGRKSIRQRLIIKAKDGGFSIKPQFCKPWGWYNPTFGPPKDKDGRKKFDASSLEEGEVVEEGIELKIHGSRVSDQCLNSEIVNFSHQYLTERALVELILPCIDQSSDGSRNTLASDLIKQMSSIEQLINGVTRGVSKQTGCVVSGIEGPSNKGNNRKAIRGGSPGPARWSAVAVDSVPPSPAALRTSLSLRLQLLLRLLPIIFMEGEPSRRNMRHILASVVLRLLGSRVVHEDVDPDMHKYLQQSELKSTFNFCGESLFDWLLLVLHGLLSGCQPCWLNLNPVSKLAHDPAKGFAGFDRDVVEGLQNELDHMQLPESIRWQIQTAMPVLAAPTGRCSISCRPPSVPPSTLPSLQPTVLNPNFQTANTNPPHRNSFPTGRAVSGGPGQAGQPKTSSLDPDMEVDPWTLLEDGASSNNSDHNKERACSWLKGAVRIRRTDLTYIGAVDDDS